VLDRDGVGGGAEFGQPSFACGAVVALDAYLDQFVGGERAVRLIDDRLGEAVVTDHDDGFLVVGLGAEEFALLRIECFHAAILPDGGPVMKRSAKTHIWHQRHANDFYVQKATKEGYRSRAAFKLMEIVDRDRLVHAGMRIVDLGSAPGGWCQIVSERLHTDGRLNGHLLAIDILPMEPVKGVEFLHGDFTDDAVLADFVARLDGHPLDLVLSDIAPNLSGILMTDQARAYDLAEMALAFAVQRLRPEGVFLIKVFQGAGFEVFLRQIRAAFKTVTTRKPKASRDESTEVYLLARGVREGVSD
jgi:23S rRNA (uridine2552-2'-O)-methyltransferase